MRTATRRALSTIAASSVIALAAACSAGGGGGATQAEGDVSEIAVPDTWDGGDVTLQLWNDNAAIQPAVDLFNEAHADQGIQIEFTETTELNQAIRNAATAGNAPDLFVTQTADLASFISEGIAADLTAYYGSIQDRYSEVVNQAVTTGGRQWAVPAAAVPTFMLYNAKIFEDHGLEYPTTYEEFLETGKELAKDDIAIFNIAGEDPTTFIYMAWELGAQWYQIEGDGWRVNIDSPETKRAAEYFDDGLEAGMFSKISYAEYAAMMQSYNEGDIATRQLSTWQTKGFQDNLTDANGQWDPEPNLEWEGNGPANAAFTRAFAVNAGGASTDAAVYAASWLSSDTDSIKALSDPESGLAWFPAVADPAQYIDQSTPSELLGGHVDDWTPTVENAVKTQKGDWTYGPNWAGAFLQLQDLWGKAVAGDMKAVDIAPAMQEWVVEDLKAQGITVIE